MSQAEIMEFLEKHKDKKFYSTEILARINCNTANLQRLRRANMINYGVSRRTNFKWRYIYWHKGEEKI